MKFLSPTESKRLNEVLGFVFLACGLLVLFSLISYQTYDPSWETMVPPPVVEIIKRDKLFGFRELK